MITYPQWKQVIDSLRNKDSYLSKMVTRLQALDYHQQDRVLEAAIRAESAIKNLLFEVGMRASQIRGPVGTDQADRSRYVSALQVAVKGPPFGYWIVWPEIRERGNSWLKDSRLTWMNARAGDVVVCRTDDGTLTEDVIVSIEIYRGGPGEHEGIVTSAEAWLAGEKPRPRPQQAKA